MDKQTRMQELISRLNLASDAYYGGKEEVLSNFEWDALFDELTMLEEETGIVLPDSPTHKTSSSDADNGGEKELHEFPALSLAKTKKVSDLQNWADGRSVWLSWKLDGLTIVLTYDNGTLTRILTRGNGTEGTNITYMKDAIQNIPVMIPYFGHLVVRGEALISYTDFNTLNETIEDEDERYANPRNLASGTLGLDASNLDKVRERNVSLHAFTLVYIDDPVNSWGERMDLLDSFGFCTVARELVTPDVLPDAVDRWTKQVESGEMDYPVDGLVITYDDVAYASTGSVTGHHATRAGLAFKWQDESVVTTLDHIEWSCAASTITPVAVFDPVQLEGTTVSRASLCNISECKRLGIGADRKTKVEVIKANKIIPKVISVPEAEGIFEYPAQCPVCHAPTQVRVSALSGVETLRCSNPKCPAKHLKKFERCVSDKALDIDGMSIQTIATFINKGFISGFSDLYHLSEHADEIREMEGFGEKSCQNLLSAIEKSRDIDASNFIYALNIPMIGRDASKRILSAIGSGEFFRRLENGTGFDDIDGIGPEKSNAILLWYSDPENRELFHSLQAELRIRPVEPVQEVSGSCKGLTFVITGDVHTFKNRDAFKAFVEAQGGTVTGGVSKKTDFLVNNDLESTSGKNQKAKALGIPIISEDEFLARFKED